MTISTDALLAKLFRWKTKETIEGVDFYIRVVSDQAIDDARREALLEARKLRRSLRDPNSDDYLIYLDPLSDLTDDQLRNVVTTSAMREVMRDYFNTNPRPVLPALGDNPTQAEQEEYEVAKEEREGAYIADMEIYVENWRKDFVAMLEKRDTEWLLRTARANRTDQVCEERFSEVFQEYVVAAAIYTDDKYKTRMFTVEQYRQLPTEVKERLRDAYNNMSVSPDQIKN